MSWGGNAYDLHSCSTPNSSCPLAPYVAGLLGVLLRCRIGNRMYQSQPFRRAPFYRLFVIQKRCRLFIIILHGK